MNPPVYFAEVRTMLLQVYRGDQLAATFEYGQEPTYHGGIGHVVKEAIEASPKETLSAISLAGVPNDWLQWVASIVFPALACGAFVRYNVSRH
jgi:hypothetical protein